MIEIAVAQLPEMSHALGSYSRQCSPWQYSRARDRPREGHGEHQPQEPQRRHSVHNRVGSNRDFCSTIYARRRKTEAYNSKRDRRYKENTNTPWSLHWNNERSHLLGGRHLRNARDKMPSRVAYSPARVGPIPFWSKIRTAETHKSFRAPHHIKKYDGNSNLKNWLENYRLS